MSSECSGPGTTLGMNPDLGCDVVLTLMKFVDCSTLVAMSETCKLWRSLSMDGQVWETLYREKFARVGFSGRLSSNFMGSSACALGCHSEQALVEEAERLLGEEGATPGWRKIYLRRQEVERNWKHGHAMSRRLSGHGDNIRCAQLAGNTLVTASGSTLHLDCTIRVWDIDTGTQRQLLRGHMGPVWCMSYDPASGRIASGSDDYTVRYWDCQSGDSVSLQDPDSAVRCIHMDQQGHQLVAGTEFGKLLLWDTRVLDELMAAGVSKVKSELELVDQQLSPRRVVVDGMHLAKMVDSAGEDGNAVSAIQVQGNLCASASYEPLSNITLWNLSKGQWDKHASFGDETMLAANSMSFESSLGIMVAGCGDRCVRVWDLESGASIHELRGHKGDVCSHQFDDRLIASSDLAGHILVWDQRSGKVVQTLEHGAPVHAFEFQGSRLVSGTWDGRVLLWDLRTGCVVKDWRAHSDRVWAVSLSDYTISAASLDRTISIHSLLPEDLGFATWGVNSC